MDIDIDIEDVDTIRYWLMQLWGLRRPMICPLQLDTQGSWCCSSGTWEQEGWWCRFKLMSEGLRHRTPRQENVSLSWAVRQRKNSNFLSPFYSFQSLKGLDDIYPHRGVWQLYPVHIFRCSSLLETSSQTHSEIILKQVSGHATIQSSWHIKINVTPCVEEI